MTLALVENSLRIAASVWATANSLTFEFDNSVGIDVTNPTQPILNWGFNETDRERISSALVKISGECRGTILIPATPSAGTSNPVREHIAMAELLLAEFRGKSYSTALVLSESRIEMGGTVGSMRAITAVIEWEFVSDRYIIGHTTLTPVGSSGAELAYDLLRKVWGTEVQPTISTNTYFDGTPGLAAVIPACLCSFLVLQGFSLEMNSTRSLGRVNVDLHYPLGIGVQTIQLDTDLIVQAFDSIESGGVVFQTPRVTRLGRTTEETWHVNVRMPFTFQDIYS
jgi:hypothetical protein